MKLQKCTITDCIGNTPLILLEAVGEKLPGQILAKAEGCNPGGSAKDRVALAMILDAEKRGLLTPGGTIIEPTSGNTGIGLAMAAAARGYKTVIVMPDTMSVERQLLMKAYGAQVVLTPGAEGMSGAVAKAQQLCDTLPGSFLAGQFTNPANVQAHFDTTGPEIWRDADGKVDILVAGVGTGGTITGTGRYLKERNPGLQVVAVEPADSPLLSAGRAGSHGLQGIGANFVPAILDRSILDEIICVNQADAENTMRALAFREGILAGISSGAALWAAIQVASRPENAGKSIVVILPDSGERYLSGGIFD